MVHHQLMLMDKQTFGVLTVRTHNYGFFYKSNNCVLKSRKSKIRVQNILQKYNSYFYLTLVFVLTVLLLFTAPLHIICYNLYFNFKL